MRWKAVPEQLAPGHARPRPLDAGRGRDLVRGLVRRCRQGDHARRRTSPTSASTTASTPTRSGPARCSGAFAPCAAVRLAAERAAGRLVRAVEPDLRLDATRRSRPGRSRCSRPPRTSSARRPTPVAHSLTPCLRLQRRHRDERLSGTPVPRLRRHRPPVREHRLHGRGRRQPRLRAAHQRAARAPDLDRQQSPRHRAPTSPTARRPAPSPPTSARSTTGESSAGASSGGGSAAPAGRHLGLGVVRTPDRLHRRPARWSTSGTAAGRPAATTGRSSRSRGRDRDVRQVLRRRGAPGRVRRRPRRRVRQGEPAGDDLADAARTRRASRRTASWSPPRPPCRRSTAPRSSPGRPRSGATGYEVQWSKTQYPWKAAAAPLYTAATSCCSRASRPERGTTACAGSTRTCPGR